MVENWMDYKWMVVREAKRLACVAMTPEELVPCGLWGLYLAAQKFDPGKGVKFESFARLRVRGEMIDFQRQSFGRRQGDNSRHGRPERIGDRQFAVRDRGIAAVDARDELQHLGVPPDTVTDFRTIKPLRDGMGLSAWARKLGLSPMTLKYRIEKLGLDKALSGEKPKRSVIRDGKTLTEWAAELGVRPQTLRWRIGRYGQDLALTMGAPKVEKQKKSSKRTSYTHQGTTLCPVDWAERLGITRVALAYRVKRWGVDRALSTPPRRYVKAVA